MLTTSIIAKTRDGETLSNEEIDFMIQGFVAGGVTDYQMSAWAMAILCRGMVTSEIAALTNSMLNSGIALTRATDRLRVDKHSTGGLGDKTSLILAPLLACFELDVPMLSGRGLGITGGTLDKLESFNNYRCDLSEQEITTQLQSIGCVITGTTPEIAPADRRLYQLRDVTATVPSIALITASIMSKKLAESLDALVLDVKYGSGAFMRTIEDARQLADSLSSTGERMGVPTSVVLSDMNQPLGKMVGNACEVTESIEVLKNSGPADVRELTLKLCAELLVQTKRCESQSVALDSLSRKLSSGEALRRFQLMVEAQGGKFGELLPLATPSEILSLESGRVESMDGQKIGQAVIELGGGRRKLGDSIDHSVGLSMSVRLGQLVEVGEPLVTLFSNAAKASEAAEQLIHEAIRISPIE